MENIIVGITSSAISVSFAVWLLKVVIEKRISLDYKKLEVLDTEVKRKRAELAAKVFRFCRRCCGGGMTKEELCKSGVELSEGVALWFPDKCYVAFRNFVGKFLEDLSAKNLSWNDDAEPVLQGIVSAMRPESKILDVPGIHLLQSEQAYHFLPNVALHSEEERTENPNIPGTVY